MDNATYLIYIGEDKTRKIDLLCENVMRISMNLKQNQDLEVLGSVLACPSCESYRKL